MNKNFCTFALIGAILSINATYAAQVTISVTGFADKEWPNFFCLTCEPFTLDFSFDTSLGSRGGLPNQFEQSGM
jgi:hypothetical protein